MLNKIDFLSPPITLFHLEKRTHTSKVGAVLVIILLITLLSYAIYLITNLISHKNMTYIFHKKFEFEAGYYSFNSSSIFHFIQIFSSENGGYFDKFNSTYIRAFTTYAHSNLQYDKLDLYDHWVFDNCRKGIDDKDLDRSLFQNVENFTNGVCIRYYYNSIEKKYYSSEEKGFNWPHLEHGISQRKNIYLTTIVQKCSNDSIINEIFGKCPTQKEIDDYVDQYFGIYLYFTDTQVDPTDFKNPITKYLQVVTTGIGTPQTYVESYMHFSPLRIRTIGTIFGDTSDINSFYFDFNRKGAANNYGEKYFTITKYYHLMQNNVQIYERRYSNIFNIFSEIGGIAQFIFYLFYWLNFIYNQFIIDFDTNSLFFSITNHEFDNKGNNNISINNITSQVAINGKDNRLDYNLNALSPRKRIKKVSNRNLSVNKAIKDENNNKSKDYGNNIQNIENDRNYNDPFENDNQNNKNITKNDKYAPGNKKSFDNSQVILYNLNKGKDLIRNLGSNSNKNILNIFKNKNKLNSKSNKEFNKFKLDYFHEDNVVFNNHRIKNIQISKTNINQIKHKKEKSLKMSDKNYKGIRFSIINFTKARFSKKDKQKYQYLTLFRKHLLSEEHLLKSHINMVLLEKKYNFNKETTNIYECYNKL